MSDKSQKKERAGRTDATRDPVLEHYIDYDVVDRNNSKIGTLQCIWADHKGEPAFVGVRTGWLFGKTHVVPANAIQVSDRGRRLRLPYDAQKVKDAPAYDSECEMDEAREWEIYKYYGVQTGWEASGRREQIAATERGPREPSHDEQPAEQKMQLSEEELKVGKRQVEAGGVRLRKIVRTETVNQPVELKREEVVIERVPAGEARGQGGATLEGDELYIPLRREEAVVEKESRVREEVRVRKKTQRERREVSGEVRREDVEIEETGEARRSDRPGAAEEIREREGIPRSQRRRS